jgi:hypothetical protein
MSARNAIKYIEIDPKENKFRWKNGKKLRRWNLSILYFTFMMPFIFYAGFSTIILHKVGVVLFLYLGLTILAPTFIGIFFAITVRYRTNAKRLVDLQK